jgi:hypothetical protein
MAFATFGCYDTADRSLGREVAVNLLLSFEVLMEIMVDVFGV